MEMADLKSTYRKAVFIWIEMVFSILIYALAVEIMKRNSAFLNTTSPLQEGGLPVFIFLILAILTFFLINYTHNQILYGVPSGNPSGLKGPLAPRLLKASLISDAICGSVAIYGLILFGLSKNTFDFYIFMALSLIYFAFSFPRYTQWEEWIQETERKESSRIFVPR